MDNSNLARMPAEIRNVIFGLCLDQDEPLVIDQYSVSKLPAITATCKQIRDETMSKYYVGRTVVIKLPSPDDHDIDSLEPAMKKTIDYVSRWMASMPQLPRHLAPRFEVRLSLEFCSTQFTLMKRVKLNHTHSASLPGLAALLNQTSAQRPLFVYTNITRFSPRDPIWVDRKAFESWGFDYQSEGVVKVIAPARTASLLARVDSQGLVGLAGSSRRNSFQESMERLRNED
ncbi:hypothetical protein LTR10_008231 [Elasticomyces elasticus]|nr:hypothetical protein LTR10_008231 [Elasticomyces elasticus]KAK4967107.1 hypothetical protein LTR42_010455 [Elasticomyces elasticus]